MIPFGLGCSYNTAKTCNADWYFNESERIIVFYATNDIEADEEIFIDYYDEMKQWEKQNLRV